MSMNPLIFIGLAGVLCTCGDISLAYWARQSTSLALLIGLGLNLAGISSYAFALTLEQVGIATALFLGFNILALSLAGFLVFSETPSPLQLVGLLLLIGSIILIEL